jgi:hypothetical protein
MQNIAYLYIIGRLRRIDRAKNVTHFSVAANSSRRDGDECKTDIT